MVVLKNQRLFGRHLRRSALALAGLIPAAQGAVAAESIGVVATADNRITGTLDQNVRELKVSQDVFRNEAIETHKGASTQLMFLDETTLTLGPESQVTLNEMVYEPQTGVGSVTLSVVRGAAKFVTGVQDSKSYVIKTPTSNIGIRGSGVAILVSNLQTIVLLLEGIAIVNSLLGASVVLDVPLTYTRISGTNQNGSTPTQANAGVLGAFGGIAGGIIPGVGSVVDLAVEAAQQGVRGVDVQDTISNSTAAGENMPPPVEYEIPC